MKLYTYQDEAVKFHIDRMYSLNAFTMGLGKTITALEMGRRLGVSTLIVCPAFLKKNWEAEIEKFGFSKSQFEITSYASFSKRHYKGIDFVIMDEAHYIKNPEAKRTNKIYEWIKKFKPNYLLMMTGTPMKNNVGEFFMYLKFCNLSWRNINFDEYLQNYHRFRMKFMKATTMHIHGRSVIKFEGKQNMDEFKKLIEPTYLRKKIGEVKLPPIVKKIITGNSTKYDKQIKKAFEDNDKPAYMSIKAESALVTAKATVELVKSFNDEQVIIFSDHVASTEKISNLIKCPNITGKTTQEKREQTIKEFKEGKHQFLCATYKTLGVGLTLTNCFHMIYNDLPFVVADIQQASKRIHRIGQENTCFYYYMFSSKVHEDIYNKLIKKHRDIGEF